MDDKKPNQNIFKIDLGVEVKHKITGFIGTVVCRSQWLHGVNVYIVQAGILIDGLPIEPQYFEEGSLIDLAAAESVTKIH